METEINKGKPRDVLAGKNSVSLAIISSPKKHLTDINVADS